MVHAADTPTNTQAAAIEPTHPRNNLRPGEELGLSCRLPGDLGERRRNPHLRRACKRKGHSRQRRGCAKSRLGAVRSHRRPAAQDSQMNTGNHEKSQTVAGMM
eukprot:4013670-Pleurochrysis_carterae.AAC.2